MPLIHKIHQRLKRKYLFKLKKNYYIYKNTRTENRTQIVWFKAKSIHRYTIRVNKYFLIYI